MCAALPAAPAEPGVAIASNEATRTRSDDGKIRRRIAKSGTKYPDL
jgi:hypothetical protein